MNGSSNMQVKHLSRDSFVQLLDHLIAMEPRRIYISQNEPPPEGKKVNFVSSPSFDFVLAGTKRMIFPGKGNRDVLMHTGDVHYCPAGHWKRPVWGHEHHHKMSSIIFYPEFIRVTYIDYNPANNVSYETHAADTFYHTYIPIHEAGLHVLKAFDLQIFQESSLEVLPSLLQSILIITRDVLKNDHSVPGGKRNATWVRIKHYLQDNFYYPINRNSVAKEFRMSPSYLSQLFAEKEPEGFIGFLRELRLQHGALLLTTTDLSVDEVTEQCGYISTSYFIAEFKKKYNLSPGKYRLLRQ